MRFIGRVLKWGWQKRFEVESSRCRCFSSAERIGAVKLSYNVYEDGKEVEEYVESDHSPVIVVHGLFGSKSNWHSLAKSISTATKRQVLTVDLRNHGQSTWHPEFDFNFMKNDILNLIEDLGMSSINAVGHSLGGRVVMNVALHEPEKVDKLIVVDVSPVRMSPDAGNLLDIAKAMKKVVFPTGITLSAGRFIGDKALQEIVKKKPLRQFLLTNLYEKENKVIDWRVNLDAIISRLDGIIDFRFPNNPFVKPTMFIGGALSNYLSKDQHSDILKIFPKAEFHYIPNAGHWLHAEKPREFLELVCPFLQCP